MEAADESLEVLRKWLILTCVYASDSGRWYSFWRSFFHMNFVRCLCTEVKKVCAKQLYEFGQDYHFE